MSKRKVIIDTDPGIDDLLALAMALTSDKLDILAISTVFGNVSLENTLANAKLIIDAFNKDIKIIKGSKAPLFYKKKKRSNVHGADGLGGLHEKFRSRVEEKNKEKDGFKHLYDLVKNSKEKVTIIALGPLTNIAKLLLVDDKIKDNIEEIYIMGGGINKGNTNDLVEFNFYSDGYAAQTVFKSGLPIYLTTLDVTAKVFFNKEEFNSIKTDNIRQEMIKESVAYYINLDPYLHDVVSVLSLTNKDLFEFKQCQVDIIAGEDITDGMSYINTKNITRSNVYLVDTNKRKEIIDTILDKINNIN